mgnify:FL=1
MDGAEQFIHKNGKIIPIGNRNDSTSSGFKGTSAPVTGLALAPLAFYGVIAPIALTFIAVIVAIYCWTCIGIHYLCVDVRRRKKLRKAPHHLTCKDRRRILGR